MDIIQTINKFSMISNILLIALIVLTILIICWIWNTSSQTEKTAKLLEEQNVKLDIIIQNLINKK